jgi:hypothetical protein
MLWAGRLVDIDTVESSANRPWEISRRNLENVYGLDAPIPAATYGLKQPVTPNAGQNSWGSSFFCHHRKTSLPVAVD